MNDYDVASVKPASPFDCFINQNSESLSVGAIDDPSIRKGL
ncbi:hypothetical protein B4067_0318 [Bacillus subtilis subsp. subtilis]|uniref:Uncharacterized protein n=1 Tax=Bacillus subtilis subsp. subtilis TaxID=135461 RepID=A0ABD3ZME7_BACIU|nr:hypothetical protein B4067_0318 [Bacillus subtilis subsp. subtilis]